MKKETRGRKKLPYETYRKRYPKPIEKEIDEFVDKRKKDNGYE